MQKAYLGDLPPEHDVAATVSLWQSYRPLRPSEIRAGLDGIGRIAAVARRREGRDVLRDLQATLARAMWRQASWIGRRDPRLTIEMMMRSVRWRLAS